MASRDRETLVASVTSTGPISFSVLSMCMEPKCIDSNTSIAARQEDTINNNNVEATQCRGVKCEIIKSESTELQPVDWQEYNQVTSAPAIDSNTNPDQKVIKVEPGDVDLDIGPTELQHMDAYYKDNQVNNVVKQEITKSNSNHPMLSNELDKETIRNECNVDGQKHGEAVMTAASIGSVNAAADGGRQGICIKVKGANLVIGPPVLLEKNTGVIKIENTITDNDYHLIVQGEGEYGGGKGSEHRNSEILTERHKQHKLLRCDKCVQIFVCKNSFREHYRQEHMTELLKRTIHMEQFPLEPYFRNRISCGGKLEYECLFCTKVYKSREALRRHVEVCHPPRIADMQESNVIGEIFSSHVQSDNSIYCNICGEVMTSKIHLHNHKKTVHNQQRAVSRVAKTCDYCQKTYSTKYTLEVHVRVVHRKSFHNCSKCTSYFKSEDLLQNHMMLAHAE